MVEGVGELVVEGGKTGREDGRDVGGIEEEMKKVV